jgi:hypothetical protein
LAFELRFLITKNKETIAITEGKKEIIAREFSLTIPTMKFPSMRIINTQNRSTTRKNPCAH